LVSLKSGWQDSNLRPPHPKCGAIPGYATPRKGLQRYDLLVLRQIFLKRINKVVIEVEYGLLVFNQWSMR
jgi:hypothetical protein